MRQKIRVLFYLQNLSGGGVERVHTELFKNYDREKFVYKLLLKNNQLIDYHNSVRPDDFFVTKRVSLVRRLSQPEAFLQSLCLRLPYAIIVRALLYFYKRLVIRKRIKGTVNKYFSDHTTVEELSQGILHFFSVHWQSIFVLNRAVADYCPHILVGTLTESSNALIFLSRQTLPAAHRHVWWVAIEQNNTLRRFADYYESTQEEFWNRFARVVFGSANQMIAPSEGVKTGLIQHYQVSGDRVTVIHNPVDNANMYQAEPVEITYPFIVSAGRLHSQKGFDALIRSFAKISDDTDVHLCILGKGKLEPELQELAQHLNVTDRVHFLGFQSDLWSYMKAARLFVLSSRYEGFGNVIIEAMACGCPVVSFDCDYGPSEIIRHAENGWLVAENDEEGLAKAMLKVLNDEALRQQLMRKGTKRASDFNVEKIARQYERVFQSSDWSNTH